VSTIKTSRDMCCRTRIRIAARARGRRDLRRVRFDRSPAGIFGKWPRSLAVVK
jgi:hypothetical protein